VAAGTPAGNRSKNRTLLIVLAVVGALLAVCCVGGVFITMLSSGDGTPQAEDLPDVLGTTPVRQEPGGADEPPAEPEPEPTLPPGTITDRGLLLVGEDIPPGTYRGFGCSYWERVSDASGEFDAIIANGNLDGDEHLTVTIRESDYGFDNRCSFLVPLEHIRTVPESAETSEEFGVLAVGKDIHPGTWRGTAVDHCYWARLSGFSGEFGDIIANDNVDPGSKFTITVRASDKGLQLESGCGPLTKA